MLEVGKKYGKLTFIRKVDSRKGVFECECGRTKVINMGNVGYGAVKSCGCLRSTSHNIHGHSGEKLYYVWHTMIERCTNPDYRSYKYYGGRGITVCDEWKNDYMVFRGWALDNGYKDGLTLDRINNNKSYHPSNCHFVTMYQQNRNKRTNVMITFRGKTMCMSDWARATKIPRATIRKRYDMGWSADEIFLTPISCRKSLSF